MTTSENGVLHVAKFGVYWRMVRVVDREDCEWITRASWCEWQERSGMVEMTRRGWIQNDHLCEMPDLED